MATGSASIELCINEDGEYTVSDDRDRAIEEFNENFSGPFLVYTINIEGVPLPETKEINIDLGKGVKSTDGSLTITVTQQG